MRSGPGSPRIGQITGREPRRRAFTRDELRRAIKAFKKRLKLVQRDDESSSPGGPLSGGKKSGIVGIVPPPGFPPEIWDALVDTGRTLPESGDGTEGGSFQAWFELTIKPAG